MKSNTVTTDYINDLISDNKDRLDIDNISDGYHSFGDLYNHRCILFIALCKSLYDNNHNIDIWKSKHHHDGSSYEDMFLVGLETKYGEISYHIPMKYWDLTNFITELDRSPEFDGYTSDDVLNRLINLIMQ